MAECYNITFFRNIAHKDNIFSKYSLKNGYNNRIVDILRTSDKYLKSAQRSVPEIVGETFSLQCSINMQLHNAKGKIYETENLNSMLLFCMCWMVLVQQNICKH